ncbi:MAG: DUF4013 domain-containing protein [Candidatus Diapherotrites archaeon]
MGQYFEIFKIGFESTKELIVGLLFGIFTFLTFGLGSVLIFGFAGDTLRNSLNGKIELAEWEHWKEILIVGVKVGFGFVVYTLPAWILLLIEKPAVFYVILIMFSSFENLYFALNTILMAGYFVYFCILLFLFMIWLMPSAIISVIEADRLSELLSFRKIFRDTLNKKYFVAWLFVGLNLFIVFIIANILSYASIPGTVLGLSLMFYIGSVTGALAFGNAKYEHGKMNSLVNK